MTTSFLPEELVQVACIWEVTARKVGNVHRTADFDETGLTDFLVSAAALQVPFSDRCGRGVGLAIWSAAEATREFVGQNTNLGMILLLAPLVAVRRSIPLREGIG